MGRLGARLLWCRARLPGCLCVWGTPLLTDILIFVLGERVATLGTLRILRLACDQHMISFKAGYLELSLLKHISAKHGGR